MAKNKGKNKGKGKNKSKGKGKDDCTVPRAGDEKNVVPVYYGSTAECEKTCLVCDCDVSHRIAVGWLVMLLIALGFSEDDIKLVKECWEYSIAFEGDGIVITADDNTFVVPIPNATVTVRCSTTGGFVGYVERPLRDVLVGHNPEMTEFYEKNTMMNATFFLNDTLYEFVKG